MPDANASPKWIYAFAEGSREMRDLLGGKGANVAEMTRLLGVDKVPAGFTITTEACVAYMQADATPEGLDAQLAPHGAHGDLGDAALVGHGHRGLDHALGAEGGAGAHRSPLVADLRA